MFIDVYQEILYVSLKATLYTYIYIYIKAYFLIFFHRCAPVFIHTKPFDCVAQMSDTISMKLFNGWLVAARVRVSVNNAWKFALQSTGQRAVRLHQALTVCFYCSASGTADSLTIDHERTASFWSFLAALCLRKRCSSCRPCVVAIVYQARVRHFFNKSVGCLTIASDHSPKRTPTTLRHITRAREREGVSHRRCIVFRSGDYMLRYE